MNVGHAYESVLSCYLNSMKHYTWKLLLIIFYQNIYLINLINKFLSNLKKKNITTPFLAQHSSG